MKDRRRLLGLAVAVVLALVAWWVRSSSGPQQPEEPAADDAEDTVPAPGATDRGPRRIAVGDADEFHVATDDYRSFTEIDRG